MIEQFGSAFFQIIGGNEVNAAFTPIQLVFRTLVVFAVALLLIRIGKRRFLGNYTAFDILLGFVVGSVMSRAITGSIRFTEMILVILVLMAMHWLFATLSYYFKNFSGFVKTDARQLVTDGQINQAAMQKSKLGENDLLQAVRTKSGGESLENVKAAYLERDGSITVIPKVCEPQIVSIEVKDGVQRVEVAINA